MVFNIPIVNLQLIQSTVSLDTPTQINTRSYRIYHFIGGYVSFFIGFSQAEHQKQSCITKLMCAYTDTVAGKIGPEIKLPY